MSCCLWIPFSPCLDSDFWCWATPLCVCPRYFSWVLKPILDCPLQQGHSSYCLDSPCCIGSYVDTALNHCGSFLASMDVYLGFRIELLIRKRGKEKGSLISWSVSCLSSSSSNFSFVVVLALLILLELLLLNWFPKWSLPLSSSSSVLLSVRCIGVMVAISCINCVMPLHYLYGNTQILSIIQSPSWLSTHSSLLLHKPIIDLVL